MSNPADKVEKWPIGKLVPYARNARTHSDAQVAQIASSIKEWGWTTPVLVDPDGQIIAGHGRVLAARKLGIVEVPVMVADGWTDAQKRAYVIADNNIALGSAWDKDLLAAELSDLITIGYDTEILGFAMEAKDLITDLTAPSKFEKSLPTNLREEEGEVEYKNLKKYPLTVILDETEYQEWESMKEKRGFGDKRLLLDLMRGEV